MIVGIDFSMTCPGCCVLGTDGTFANSHHYFMSSRKRDESIGLTRSQGNLHCMQHKLWKTQEERFDHISNAIMSIVQTCVMDKDPHVYLEDYAMGAKGRVFNIGEVTGLLKHKLHRAGVPFVTVPPTVLKKFAAGKGNATKDMMYEAFLKQGNTDIKPWFQKEDAAVGSPVSDIVDAYFLGCYGRQNKDQV